MERIILFKNYKGKYTIKEYMGEKYIVSNEKYKSDADDKLSKISITFSTNASSLLLQLANCKNDQARILEFCNTYGLPASSALNRDMNNGDVMFLDIGYDVDENSIQNHDNMRLSEFIDISNFASDLLHLQSICFKKPGKRANKYKSGTEPQKEYQSLFSSIYNLLLFLYINLGLCSLEPVYFNSDVYLLQNDIWEYIDKPKEKMDTEFYLGLFASIKDKLKDKNIIMLINTLIDIMNENKCDWNTVIDFSECKIISSSLKISDSHWNTMEECGKSLFTQIVEDFVNCSTIKLAYNDEKQKYYVRLSSTHLLFASIVELYTMITSGIEIHRCANLHCGTFFLPSRSTQIYCSEDCRKTVQMKRRNGKKTSVEN